MQAELLHLFPDFKEGDWILQDDGDGPYIKEWNRPEKQPPQGRIDAVTKSQRDQAINDRRYMAEFELGKKDAAIIQWIAGLHGLSAGEAKQQLRTIFDSL